MMPKKPDIRERLNNVEALLEKVYACLEDLNARLVDLEEVPNIGDTP